MPSLVERFNNSFFNRKMTRLFYASMVFVFGAESKACEINPIDIVKSAFVYLASSGVLYTIVQAYATNRYRSHPVREALCAGLVVFVADISHRYTGSNAGREYAFRKTR